MVPMKIGVTSRNDDDEDDDDDDDDGVDSEKFDIQRNILLKVDMHNYVYA